MNTKTKWSYYFFLIVSICITSCSKESGPNFSVANSGNFSLNGTKYKADYAVYGKTGDKYNLYFYSEGVSFSDYPLGLLGYGHIVRLSMSESIYSSADFSISSLRLNETISISSGDIYIDFSNSYNTGTHYEIESGTIINQVKSGFYLFKYELILKSGETVTGSFTGSLIVF